MFHLKLAAVVAVAATAAFVPAVTHAASDPAGYNQIEIGQTKAQVADEMNVAATRIESSWSTPYGDRDLLFYKTASVDQVVRVQYLRPSGLSHYVVVDKSVCNPMTWVCS